MRPNRSMSTTTRPPPVYASTLYTACHVTELWYSERICIHKERRQRECFTSPHCTYVKKDRDECVNVAYHVNVWMTHRKLDEMKRERMAQKGTERLAHQNLYAYIAHAATTQRWRYRLRVSIVHEKQLGHTLVLFLYRRERIQTIHTKAQKCELYANTYTHNCFLHCVSSAKPFCYSPTVKLH